MGSSIMPGKKEFGDYQTPLCFAKKVCGLLSEKYSVCPQVVVEPTCGEGNFLQESLVFKAKQYYGIEINEEYCLSCKKNLAGSANIKVLHENIFNFDLEKLLPYGEEILVIGNPPWVTNSELSRRNSTNVPGKTNFKSFSGINALTGESNFDICEYIILKMIGSIYSKRAVIAMLCKSAVARNVFCEINRRNINYTSFSMYDFDAKKIFKISAGACLLVIDFRESYVSHSPCFAFSMEQPNECYQEFLYSDHGIEPAHSDKAFWGKCCFEWRQGVKHDCSKVMELDKIGESYINGYGETVDIETDYLFPLVKSSMFKTPVINSFKKYVIVTQTKVKEDTEKIKTVAPKTWEYLSKYGKQFSDRKSSIYKNAPPFSMFGIGDYSFAKYKVGISGFYKVPFFSLIYAENGTVMCDDTGYFIAFSNYDDAYTAMLVLNSYKVIRLLKTVSYHDAKRPFTKQLLNRLDMKAIVSSI